MQRDLGREMRQSALLLFIGQLNNVLCAHKKNRAPTFKRVTSSCGAVEVNADVGSRSDEADTAHCGVSTEDSQREVFRGGLHAV
jgi:hypothetical protein